MRVTAANIDKQINNYLGVLNIQQKKEVLKIAKTFAEEANVEIRPGAEFFAEFDEWYERYLRGEEELVDEKEVREKIRIRMESKALK